MDDPALTARRAGAPMDDEWIEYRRDADGERPGWTTPDSWGFAVIDLLGERRAGPIDRDEAECRLDDMVPAYLFEPYEPRPPSEAWTPMRTIDVPPDEIVEDHGAIDAPMATLTPPSPKPATLRPRTQTSRRPSTPTGVVR